MGRMCSYTWTIFCFQNNNNNRKNTKKRNTNKVDGHWNHRDNTLSIVLNGWEVRSCHENMIVDTRKDLFIENSHFRLATEALSYDDIDESVSLLNYIILDCIIYII